MTGMSALNDGKPRTISFTYDRSSFTVKEDPTNHPVHGCECIVKKVREEEINFKPLRAALEKPEFCCYDFSKLDHISLHHVADQALDGFIKKWNRFPVAGCEVDAEKLIDLVSSLSSGQPNDFIVKLDTRLLRIYAFGARAVLSPMAALFRGIVAQQVANAWSGESYPFRQFLYFNSVESLPSEPLGPEDVKPLNSRYDARISVFGSKLQKQLEAAKVFIVGSDTVACEFLKNAALMGVSCGEGGILTITDDGLVDNTNVSSGFMFRERDIGREKSKVSVSAAKRINDRLHLEAMQTRVCQETENVFDDIFWEKVDVVINAMDNVEDIFYIDQRCLYYRKAFIESERLGYECNTQPVIPHKTINYGASSLAGLAKHESLRNVYLFPSKIEHCLKWAKSEFDILFEKIPREVNEYISNPSGYISNRKNRAHAREIFQQVLTCLEDRCDTRTFDDCLTWARFEFEVYFVYQIKLLTSIYTEDAVDVDRGTRMWSKEHPPPHPLQFSVNDETHMGFIEAAAILRAEAFGISIPDRVREGPNLLPTDQVVTNVREDESSVDDLNGSNKNEEIVIDELVGKLYTCLKKLKQVDRMKSVQFNKDDEINYHMQMIAGLTNLMAEAYGIRRVDKIWLKSKLGETVPSTLYTSVATSSALVCLDLYKVADGNHQREAYRGIMVNPARAWMISACQASPPRVYQFGNMIWNAWDRWDFVADNPTLRDLINWFREKGLNAYSVVFGRRLIYSSTHPVNGAGGILHKIYLSAKLQDLVIEYGGAKLPSSKANFDLVVCCNDGSLENDIDIPLITVRFK